MELFICILGAIILNALLILLAFPLWVALWSVILLLGIPMGLGALVTVIHDKLNTRL